MNVKTKYMSMLLSRREGVQLIDGIGTIITCSSGGIWITQHRDNRDIVIGPGESFVLDRPGLAIVQALAASSVALEEPVQACGRSAVWIDKPLHSAKSKPRCAGCGGTPARPRPGWTGWADRG